MKNKKIVYLLLALSIIVWGGVFIRLYGVFVKDDPSSAKQVNQTNSAIYQTGKDTFELMANYKDPFFKRRTSSHNEYGQSTPARSVATPSKKKEVKVEAIVDWSFIQFKGTIKRKSTGKSVSLLVIRDKEYFLEEGNQIESVIVVKNCKDSVLIKHNGINKYIKRQ